MNKQLINKYKPEFDHWLNDGEVLYKHINSDAWWHEPWNYSPDYVKAIIINDEYVEFRKALVEGKTIESKVIHCISNNSCHYGEELPWAIDTSGKFKGMPDLYRIKSDEPKFKVGDFVTPFNRKINCSIWQIDKVLSCGTLVSGSKMLDPRTIQLWTPVKDEWCWFYDNCNSKYSRLAQFYDMNISKDNSLSTFMSSHITQWYYCEPFLNSLPSYLKDK